MDATATAADHAPPLPLSLLELATVPLGGTSRDAVQSAVVTAQRADELGFRRVWVAEHHNMPTVASTTPSVLVAHIAARTNRIRVGSGGVMLPNHAPLAVAEQFALLEALHPGRIDLGIGRAPGTDPFTAYALRPQPTDDGVDAFPGHLLDLMGLLGDRRTESGLWSKLRATPAASSHPTVMLLGSSTYSAQLAGMLGLPFAYAHHFETGATDTAVAAYRSAFQPSPALGAPHLIVTVSAMTAQTADEADRLAMPGVLAFHWLRSGRTPAMLPPDEAAAHPDAEFARMRPSTRIVGAPDDVVARLRQVRDEFSADELMLSVRTHGTEERLVALDLIARAWRIGDAVPDAGGAPSLVD